MIEKTFNFYCDESTHLENDNMPYMLISYVSSAYNQLKQHKKFISSLKKKHFFKGEIKWSNVSNSKYLFYAELLDYFFSNDLNFRAVVVNKNQINNQIEGFTYNDFYFKMYYQLLHHKIRMDYKYNIYLDIKDTISHKKLKKLNDILSNNAAIKSIQFVHSYEVSLLQLGDLIMGAINYKLRGLNKMTAKNKLIERIEKHSKIPLTSSTPKYENKFNLFFIDLK